MGNIPREVSFIASGAVEVETTGKKHKLGRGEMFGQLSLLSRKTCRVQVTAISHSTLLVLDEARFRRLLEKSETLRAAVKDSAEKRGLATGSLGLQPKCRCRINKRPRIAATSAIGQRKADP